MTNVIRSVLLLAVFGTATAPLFSQVSSARPPRDVRGTARVSGVVAGVDGAPVAGVTLTLMNSAWKRETAVSDERGRFAFTALAVDLYHLRAEKSGYLPTEYGALRPEGEGTPIALDEGQRVEALILTLVRTGAIGGTVRDADGGPATGMSVYVTPKDGNGIVAVGHSDERGVYRVEGVRAGEYKVLAMPADERKTVPVFHGGTTSPSQAATVRLDRGEERDGIDITLVEESPASLAGVILDVGGLPAAGVQVFAIPLAWGGGRGRLTRTSGPNGEFAFEDLFPGRYGLRAYLTPASDALPSDPATLWAVETVDVPTMDAPGVMLRLQPPLVFSGRVTFVGRSIALPDPGTVRVGLQQDGVKPTLTEVRPDGTFERSILPGVYQIEDYVPGLAPGWRLRSAVKDGRDLFDTPLEFSLATGSMTGIELTFSDLHTKLSGLVTTSTGAPISACYVVAFPTNRALWSPPFQRLMHRRPATNGRFVFVDLPPGDYFVAAVPDLDPVNWRAADVLEPLVARATRVSLRDGEQKSLDLRAGRRSTRATNEGVRLKFEV
ncbi:MAG TPA: carboxypeptidase-like regulatory domain-containing protein [Vicinamibacterales bacterium]|nr:carboxypeptidase-like regulatory domain-containing protein [Vicinamibacterales bacterium]